MGAAHPETVNASTPRQYRPSGIDAFIHRQRRQHRKTPDHGCEISIRDRLDKSFDERRGLKKAELDQLKKGSPALYQLSAGDFFAAAYIGFKWKAIASQGSIPISTFANQARGVVN